MGLWGYDGFTIVLHMDLWLGDRSCGSGLTQPQHSHNSFSPHRDEHDGVKLDGDTVLYGWYFEYNTILAHTTCTSNADLLYCCTK